MFASYITSAWCQRLDSNQLSRGGCFTGNCNSPTLPLQHMAGITGIEPVSPVRQTGIIAVIRYSLGAQSENRTHDKQFCRLPPYPLGYLRMEPSLRIELRYPVYKTGALTIKLARHGGKQLSRTTSYYTPIPQQGRLSPTEFTFHYQQILDNFLISYNFGGR